MKVTLSLAGLLSGLEGNAQTRIWSVDDCIQYALEKNIQVQKAGVTRDMSEINLNYARSAWYPSLSGSARENLSWAKETSGTAGSSVYKGTNGTTLSLSSGMTIFNGNKLKNQVQKARTDLEADQYNTDIIRENVSLSVLDAYLQVLYSEELVKNSTNQIISTEEQLNLASERMKLGVISNSDYLQVKSQLATEKQTLATAQSQLAINRITLMQLMELRGTNDFAIEHPNIDSMVNEKRVPDPVAVYEEALGFKPEVKNAELSKRSSQISEDIARAGYYPDISFNAGLSSLYSSTKDDGYGSQFKDNLAPAVGITASIPIYTNRQVRTNVQLAKKNTTTAELEEINVKNTLRKSIEQACQDVSSSQTEFEASSEAYKAVRESFDVAAEKFAQGLMNSVDFLVQKTSFISAESSFLQSKYRLVFSYKVLDFYSGKPLTLKK